MIPAILSGAVAQTAMVSKLIIPAFAIIMLLAACTGGGQDSASSIGTPGTPDGTLGTSAVPSEAPAERAGIAQIATPEAVPPASAPSWRYVDSGWIEPPVQEAVGPLERQLRGVVITSQEELENFRRSSTMKLSKGTTTSLGRIDFSTSVLIAAYLMWQPVQGDPLKVVGFSLKDRMAEVFLELDSAPQGEKYPYLFAPMTMVAVDRDQFPAGEPVDFAFHLDGEYLTTVSAEIN